MFTTPTPTSVRPQPFHEILERVALPLMLFSAVLFILLFISWFGILPRFTRFAVANTSLSPTDMATYVSHLKAELTDMEQKRDHLVLPINDPGYNALKIEKMSTMNALDVRTRLLDVATSVTDADHAVFIDHLSLDNATQMVSVSGDIRNVGPRSMTVLASYVEAVQGLPFVDHLTPPAFTRTQDQSGAMHSPFTMQFTLKSSAP
jgi:hypothetical protein